jgi:peptidoglycan/xylan/chitin deacetylase (PgdA/CDA1 family)
MYPRRLVALMLASSVAACGALSGCATETGADDDEEFVQGSGDGDGADEIVSERQLMGSELPDKTITLTFDDGPGPRTAELADYLGAQGVPATFFINGKNVPGRQATLDTIVARGHLLANHTQNHLQLTKLSAARVVSEVSETDAFITSVQPDKPSVIRAPFGAWTGTTARAINATSMKKYVGSVFWDVGGELTASSAADWACWGKGVSIERCGALYLQEIRARKHGIVLMHDVHGRTIDMVKQILPTLKAEGFTFAALLDVPSVKRALAAAAAPPANANDCSSATLGRSVAENSCVQSRSNQKWFRCVGGEWASSTGPDDAKCTAGKFPLQ